MSRTSFAFHFRRTAGVAPLTYLTQWRMHLAERALREEDTPVAVLARSPRLHLGKRLQARHRHRAQALSDRRESRTLEDTEAQSLSLVS